MPHGKIWVMLVILSVSGMACGAEGDRPVIPDGWRLVEFAGAFSFAAPESLRNTDQQLVDSRAAIWRDERVEVQYDYGWHSSPLTEFDDQLVSSNDATLGGKVARFIETGNLVGVHVPVVFDMTRFTMTVKFADEQDRELARSIIESVRFDTPAN